MGRSESLTQTFSALCFLAAGLMFAGRVYSTVKPARLSASGPEPPSASTPAPVPASGAPSLPSRTASTAQLEGTTPSTAAQRQPPSPKAASPQPKAEAPAAKPHLTGAVLPLAQQTLSTLFPPELANSATSQIEGAIADAAVVDLSDRRVYIYEGDRVIADYAVGIGREHWETPTGDFQVIDKQENPVWRHPFTREIVGPGPENPLGSRWIGFWTNGTHEIGFHGTNNSSAIGQAISHGCIRMRNADVEALYTLMPIGTPVTVRL